MTQKTWCIQNGMAQHTHLFPKVVFIQFIKFRIKMFLTILSSLDPSLGRVDKHSLPTQTLMELLVAGINSDQFQNDDGSYKDIKDWHGVVVNNVNAPTHIGWTKFFSMQPSTIDLAWLPLSIEQVRIPGNRFHGRRASCQKDSTRSQRVATASRASLT